MTRDLVVDSVNNLYADRCVDFIRRPDGRFVFKEFRRDPEDQGAWFVTSFDKDAVYPAYEDALAAALAQVAWLADAVAKSPPFAP